jgi:hypothetical protein
LRRDRGGKWGEGVRARCVVKREERGPVWRARARGGLAAGKTWDRRRQEAVGVACEQGRRESSAWAMPRERGPVGEEGKWAGPRENSTLLDLFEYFKKT